MKYLYGAAIQGIQSFIFQTNKLQEIIGASELIEIICSDFFKSRIEKSKFNEDNLILSAAGNIKYIFDEYEDCQNIVFKFPKEVMEMAPGITISQAVVKYDKGGLNQALQQLEEKLRAQRSKISIPLEMGFMGIERVRRTGGLAYNSTQSSIEREILDEATIKKIKASNDSLTLFDKISNNLPINRSKDLWNDIDKLFESENKAWIAVIHADGNGLGAIIQNINNALKSNTDDEIKNAFKTFSQSLGIATKKAAQKAFSVIIQKEKKDGLPYPIRPIILGGDDLTAIVRADLALDFTVEFLKEFENQTKDEFAFLKDNYGIRGFEEGISACAGIAFVKKSYPFHYAVSLADKLCSDAKRFVKETIGYDGLIPRSSLAFFKIQDSFVESDLKLIKQRSLYAQNLSFDYGPYLVGRKVDGYAHIEELIEKIKVVEEWENKDNSNTNGISKLRHWITESYKDESTSNFILERMKTVNEQFIKEIGNITEKDEKTGKNKSIIYDLIQLTSLKK